jgi:uncharacterized lipoprotein YehR (DUF1307 family)
MNTRSEEYRKLHRELNHTLTMYGNSLINSDKDNAKKFLESIQDTFDDLEALTTDLERTENTEEKYAALLSEIAQEV